MRCQNCSHPMLPSDRKCPSCRSFQSPRYPGEALIQRVALSFLAVAFAAIFYLILVKSQECSRICPNDNECHYVCFRLGANTALKLKNLPVEKP